MRRFLTFYLIIGLLPRLAIGADLTLDEVLAKVKSYHPAIQEAQYSAKELRSKKHAESFLSDPKLGIAFDEVPLKDPALKNADKIEYSIAQEIPFPTVLTTKNRALDAAYQAGKSLATGAEREILLETKKAYFGLVATKNRIINYQTMKNSYDILIKTMAKRYASNTTPQNEMGNGFTDLMTTKMKKAELETTLFDLHHQEESLTVKLNLMMGNEAHTPLNVSTPPLKQLKIDINSLEEKFKNQNSDLESLKWNITQAKREKSLATQNLIPKLEPEFKYQNLNNRDDSYMLGMNLNVPLWLNRNTAEINAAKMNQKKNEAALANAQLSLSEKLHYLIHHASEHYKIVNKYKHEIIPYGQSALNASKTAFEANLTDTSSVLRQTLSLQEAQNTYWDMWEDYQIEYAELEQLIGEELPDSSK